MTPIKNAKIPTPEEIRNDVQSMLREKYGEQVIVPQHPDGLGTQPPEAASVGKKQPNINFDLRPTELESFLQQYVVGQDEAVEVLATKICTHFNRMKLETSGSGAETLLGNVKSNILMIGPTGVGKTYLIKIIAKKIGVPFVKGDATKFSETGYVGGDVDDLVRNLVHEANGEIHVAEYGIIYLDEIDKIASSGNGFGPDVSRSGVQRNLLKLMEEAEVDLKVPHDLAAQMEAAMEAQRTGKVTRKKINTKNILFVTSGAFFGLTDIIRKRMKQQPIGFTQKESDGSDVADEEILKLVKSEDLIRYGFESEFVGRLPVVVALNSLDIDGLYQILSNPNSAVVLGKKYDFLAYGIDLEFEDSALRRIAELAWKERTGARGLTSVIDRLLMKFEKMLPDTDIHKLTVTLDMIEHPLEELDKLLTQYYVKKFQKRFLTRNSIVVTFTPGAVGLLKQLALDQRSTFEQITINLLGDYEYGLKLLNCDEFIVDEEIVKNPKRRLEELIKSSYEKHK